MVLLEKNLVQTNVTMLPAIYDDDALILYFLSYDVQKLVTSLRKLYQAITIKRRHQFQPIGGNWLPRLGSNSVASVESTTLETNAVREILGEERRRGI